MRKYRITFIKSSDRRAYIVEGYTFTNVMDTAIRRLTKDGYVVSYYDVVKIELITRIQYLACELYPIIGGNFHDKFNDCKPKNFVAYDDSLDSISYSMDFLERNRIFDTAIPWYIRSGFR